MPTNQQLHSQPSQAHQNQQVPQTYWKSPGGIDTKSVGGSVVDAKPTGVAANFTNQSFPLIHNPQSSFPNVVPPTAQPVNTLSFLGSLCFVFPPHIALPSKIMGLTKMEQSNTTIEQMNLDIIFWDDFQNIRDVLYGSMRNMNGFHLIFSISTNISI